MRANRLRLTLLSVFLMGLLCCPVSRVACAGEPFESGNTGAEGMLRDFADSYRLKAPDSLSLIVQFDIGEQPESWHVLVERLFPTFRN